MASSPQHTPTAEADIKLELPGETVSTSLALVPAAQPILARLTDSHGQSSAAQPQIPVQVTSTASLILNPARQDLPLSRVQQILAGQKDSDDWNLTAPAPQDMGGQMDSHSTPMAAEQLCFGDQDNYTSLHPLMPVEQALGRLKEYMDQNFTPSTDQQVSDEIKDADFDFYWTFKGRRIVRSEHYIQLASEKKLHIKSWRMANLEKKKAYMELCRAQAKFRKADEIAAKSEFNVKSVIEHTCWLTRLAAADRLKQHQEKAAKLKHQHLDHVRKQVIKDLEARLTPMPAGVGSGSTRPARKRRTKKK
ncbi:hypothetical protein DV737_g3366, partial [Chaetothyriales sp. CBS 132003]